MNQASSHRPLRIVPLSSETKDCESATTFLNRFDAFLFDCDGAIKQIHPVQIQHEWEL
jgi:hypothetical protein